MYGVEVRELLEAPPREPRLDGARGLGLPFGIQPGEAACVALALKRGWILATDDQDGLTALEALDPGHAYERTRRLLQRAATEVLIGKEAANELYAEMRLLGLRDSDSPFPKSS